MNRRYYMRGQVVRIKYSFQIQNTPFNSSVLRCQEYAEQGLCVLEQPFLTLILRSAVGLFRGGSEFNPSPWLWKTLGQCWKFLYIRIWICHNNSSVFTVLKGETIHDHKVVSMFYPLVTSLWLIIFKYITLEQYINENSFYWADL